MALIHFGYKRDPELLREREVFFPEAEEDMTRSKPKTRSEAKRLSKEVVTEEAAHTQTIIEEQPLSRHDSQLHNEEEVPP